MHINPRTFMKSLPVLVAMFFVLCLGSVGSAQTVEKMSATGLMQFIGANKGRVVVVNFWATWCQPCVQEFPGLIALREGFPESELTVLGVSVDYNLKAAQRFVDRSGVNFPVFLDEGDISSTFDVQGIPRTMVFNGAGKKIFDHVGYIEPASFRHIVERVQAMP